MVGINELRSQFHKLRNHNRFQRGQANRSCYGKKEESLHHYAFCISLGMLGTHVNFSCSSSPGNPSIHRNFQVTGIGPWSHFLAIEWDNASKTNR